MTRRKSTRLKYGDPRTLFESKTTAPFKSPNGVHYDAGTVVKGSTHIELSGTMISLVMPSMAELMYLQSEKQLSKAASIKTSALRTEEANGNTFIADEEQFMIYMQLMSLGILGLYAALEAMVFELYIRKYKERPVVIDGNELSFTEFTNKGFERKLTSIAASLSGKPNIVGSDMHSNLKEIHNLRKIIQHFDVERREDYFLNLPNNHPLKTFPGIDPSMLIQNAREILDHYKLS